MAARDYEWIHVVVMAVVIAVHSVSSYGHIRVTQQSYQHVIMALKCPVLRHLGLFGSLVFMVFSTVLGRTSTTSAHTSFR